MNGDHICAAGRDCFNVKLERVMQRDGNFYSPYLSRARGKSDSRKLQRDEGDGIFFGACSEIRQNVSRLRFASRGKKIAFVSSTKSARKDICRVIYPGIYPAVILYINIQRKNSVCNTESFKRRIFPCLYPFFRPLFAKKQYIEKEKKTR